MAGSAGVGVQMVLEDLSYGTAAESESVAKVKKLLRSTHLNFNPPTEDSILHISFNPSTSFFRNLFDNPIPPPPYRIIIYGLILMDILIWFCHE